MKYKLKDLAVIKRGASPRPINEYVSEKGYPWLKISDFSLNDKFVYKTKEFIIEAGLKKTRYVKSGTLIVTNSATPGIPIFLMKDMCLHDGFLYFESISPKIDKEYLYYFILNNRSKLIKLGNGSVFVNLKKEILENYEIELPSIDVQHKIARYLSAIDEKIKLNNEINDNLLKQAFAIFGSKFTDVCNGTHLVSDYILPKRGKGLLSKDAVKGNIPVVAGGLEPSTFHNVANTSAPVLTISASGANAGFIRLWNSPVWSSDSSFIDKNTSEYVYFWYVFLKKRQEEIYGSQTGSAQPHIYPYHIGALPCSELKINDIKSFNDEVTPLFMEIGNNESENLKLANLRDSLLPKLMSGEIDVDSIEL